MIQNEWLSVLRLNAIMQGLVDARNLPQELRFLGRTRVVPALDGEIMARFIGRVLIADLVADDARAAVYSVGKFQFERHEAPNLKLGVHLPQSLLNQMINLGGMGVPAIQGEGDFIRGALTRNADALLLGIRQRMEALIIAMHLDGFSYDRLGVKMENVSWGMPASLNVVAATPWSDAANATPVSDIQTINLNASVRYGIRYRRATMSTAAFQLMIATAEYQAKAKVFLPAQLTFANLSLLNLDDQRELAQRTFGLDEIELYDARYFYQQPNGELASAPFLPLDKVILTDPSLDNDPQSTDFANGIVTESVVMALLGGNANAVIGGGFPAGQRGPISYATANPTLNSPDITQWGVARGFPRKHLLQHNAVLDVGTVTDSIPVAGDLF